MTEDELIDAIRATLGGREVPAPATAEAIAEMEAACGHALPPLLVRVLTQVANGGFGPRDRCYGVRGHDRHSSDLFADLTEAATEIAADPHGWFPWRPPLVEWGCAIFTLIDVSDPAGALWGWDPNVCCLTHALFPLDQDLRQLLEESVALYDPDPYTAYPSPFYSGYFADLRAVREVRGRCGPLVWRDGRIVV